LTSPHETIVGANGGRAAISKGRIQALEGDAVEWNQINWNIVGILPNRRLLLRVSKTSDKDEDSRRSTKNEAGRALA